jgi:hypothetical protein
VSNTLGIRVESSLAALGIVWVLGGVLFVLLVKGPATVSAWFICGTGLFIAGWIIVGLPIIFLGHRVRRAPYLLLPLAAGLGGAFMLLAVGIVIRLITPQVHYARFGLSDLAFPGVAFAAATSTGALYQFFLDRAGRKR